MLYKTGDLNLFFYKIKFVFGERFNFEQVKIFKLSQIMRLFLENIFVTIPFRGPWKRLISGSYITFYCQDKPPYCVNKYKVSSKGMQYFPFHSSWCSSKPNTKSLFVLTLGDNIEISKNIEKFVRSPILLPSNKSILMVTSYWYYN